MLRFQILFSSCRNGYKCGNHPTLANGFRRFFELGKPQFLSAHRHSVAVTRLRARNLHRAYMSPTSKYERDKRELVASRQRNAEKWFPLFRRLAQLPFRLRLGLPEIARWFGYLGISFWAILSILLCLSLLVPLHLCFFLSFALFRYSPRPREQLRRQLTVNWTPIISRIAVVSVFRHYVLFFFLSFWSSVHESTMYLFLTLIHALFLSRTSLHAFSNSPFLPHPFSLAFIAVGLTVCFSFGRILWSRFK